MKKWIFFTCAMFALSGFAQDFAFRAIGAPTNPKVDVRWNRFYDYAEISDICKKMAEAYPQLVTLESIGLSYEERQIWCLIISNKEAGRPDFKPGFYIDGNIHSNEIQGSEIALYTAWYLTENFDSVAFIRRLLNDKVFYIVPTINPDGRDHYFHKANTASSPRSGLVPVDNDGDGLYDEDGYDDLDGNGHITQMRRRSSTGRWNIDPLNPNRMVRAAADQMGTWEMLGSEGLDNDGDGRVNEDGVSFSYDPNRDWGWNWQPDYIQGGAYKYPFSLPETRAVADFVAKHPNIAGAQTYHNSGGMILRGPGAKEDGAIYSGRDVRIYDQIGKRGETILPGYNYYVLWKDLYPVYGGELDWFYGAYGVFTFSNELWTSYLMFNKDYERNFGAAMKDYYLYNEYLLFGDAMVEWKPFKHPQYGDIEIGGFKKSFRRIEPSFMLESEAHRNMAFTLYHADQMPKLEVQDVQIKELSKSLHEVTAVVVNKRIIPTHSDHDLKHGISRPDWVRISMQDVKQKVVAGMVVQNRDLNICKEQAYNPSQVNVENIPGMGSVTVRWIIEGEGPYLIEVDSQKGGRIAWSNEEQDD